VSAGGPLSAGAYMLSFKDTGYNRFLAGFLADGKYVFQGAGDASIGSAISGASALDGNHVFTGLADLAAPMQVLRIDGTEAASTAAATGGGTFGTGEIVLGRRAGTATNHMPGRIYGAVWIDRALSGEEAMRLETHVAHKTGVMLP